MAVGMLMINMIIEYSYDLILAKWHRIPIVYIRIILILTSKKN